MRPLAITLENFRSFRGSQRFQFPESPGLYFMTGVNEVEPRLEANGAGKSTVWDALAWVLFDRTPAGLRAGDVCNWDAKGGTRVELDFILDEGDDCVWTVTRTWKPNTWTLRHLAEYITDEEVVDLTKDERNPVLDWLRLGSAAFLTCVLTAQRQPMFLDLRHDAQTSLFSGVLGLDQWLEHSAKASKMATAQDLVVRGFERDLSMTEGRIEELGRRDLKADAETWEKGRQERLAALKEEHSAGVARAEVLWRALDEAKAHEDKVRGRLAAAQPDKGLQDRAEDARAEVRQLVALEGTDAGALKAFEDRLWKLKEGLDANCPVCGQEVDTAHLRRETSRCMDAIDDAERTLHATQQKVKEADAQLRNLVRELADQEDARRQAQDDVRNAAYDTAAARRAHETNERELDRIEDRSRDAEDEPNPYAQAQERADEDGRRLRAEAGALRRRLDAARERQELFAYWVKGFKEVRLAQVARALDELEVEVNSCASDLGLVDWEVRFAVDRETKGGTIARGFNCAVLAPGSTRAVPWEAWSGGEAQRLRLGATMGLADLIRGRAGATIPLEVWDEPTAGLSAQGISDLLEALERRARRERRQVWVVDHSSHDFGGFAGGCEVRKTVKDGSVITQW